jgi:hypothetical protein
MAGLTKTKPYLNGATIHLWGIGLLASVFIMAVLGGYFVLEKTQIVIVALMLAAVVTVLIIFGPDWLELLRGLFIPQRLEFPAWLAADPNPTVRRIVERPVWVEVSLYTGVIGGAAYDYLAYASYLRDKGWGNAAPVAEQARIETNHAAAAIAHPADDLTLRQWLRAPLIDCTLSFAIVLVFSAVFVASGKLLLGPAHQIPGDGNFLEYQARFVTSLHPWLYPLYAIGAFLTMFGTLYGTLEIAPTILRETVLAVAPNWLKPGRSHRLRMVAIIWVAGIAFLILAASFVYQLNVGKEHPAGLTEILKPVNLFTGVLACGLICLSNPWIDRHLPARFRMPFALVALNVIGGLVFIVVALRSYWDYAGWRAMLIVLGIFAFGMLVAMLRNAFWSSDDPA